MVELILYNYWRSSSSHRVRIALGVKGLTYTYASVDIVGDEPSRESYAQRSPTRYVPCLSIDGVHYVESVSIIELLDERFPLPRLYPLDAHRRARVRALVEFINSGIQPLHNRRVLLHLAKDAGAQKAWAAHFIDQGLSALERMMDQGAREGVHGRYAFGDDMTAADVFVVPQVTAALRFGVDVARFPRVHSAFEAAMRIEAVSRAAPEHQPDAPTGSSGR